MFVVCLLGAQGTTATVCWKETILCTTSVSTAMRLDLKLPSNVLTFHLTFYWAVKPTMVQGSMCVCVCVCVCVCADKFVAVYWV